ncbi:MAG: hypothetical protein V2J24_17020 [Pseudomonadales bacterium]|jgi:hypothetical protein|nr:hypothetical protein [Pseudomonadales bacterium]
MNAGDRLLARFSLGPHVLEVRGHRDASLSLWLDGCERKRRGAGGGAAWLWTNVELPFEDHHLVEVRRSPDAEAPLDVRVNGEPVTCVPDQR